ncbi:hypothetical protein AMATHDRAFT_393 [Amanita thiersii Skay4041]|uniref:RRM domain-containing protein n=1 Tax=Amanita thiersii Skay4041 TaxID=703135 RepID=A0A2A9NXB6_9AGAR|nr:hypothetical protein AMATHDRAFT_393 [Amanita thiersii Skay4041]
MPYRPPIRSRAWGTRFDTLLPSPSSSPPMCGPTLDEPTTKLATLGSSFTSLSQANGEKTPHEASIFVGSLPCNIDQAKLGRLLSEHLAEHCEVKSIKVVRDSKGGICAFIQCQDALSAASLIHTLRTTPSKPFMGRILRYEPARAFRTLLISYRAPVQASPSSITNDQVTTRQTTLLDLPHAMRLWKSQDTKHHNILYNADAVEVENRYSTEDQEVGVENKLFLQPLLFDEGTLHSIVSYFGPLEQFELLSHVENCDGDWSAFFTTSLLKKRLKYAEPRGFNELDAKHTYPFPHSAPRSTCMDVGCWEVKWKHRDDCISALMTFRRIPHFTVTWAHQPPQSSTAGRPLSHDDSKTRVRVTGWHTQLDTSSTSSKSLDGPRSDCTQSQDAEITVDYLVHDENKEGYPNKQNGGSKLDWCDDDVSPLMEIRAKVEPEWAAWEEETECSLALHAREDNDALSTPGLGMSPVTPKSFGSGFPSTPTEPNGDISGLSLDNKANQEGAYLGVNALQRRMVDPTTLFVGGLEMFGSAAWDEAKVRKCFEKFGGLESVKFIRPYNSCSAFAFVKFDNIDSPARAVKEEHNRVHEGRAIRVQLREINPNRGSWKPLRVRVRCSSLQACNSRHSEPTGTNVEQECQGSSKINTDHDVLAQNVAIRSPVLSRESRFWQDQVSHGQGILEEQGFTNDDTSTLSDTNCAKEGLHDRPPNHDNPTIACFSQAGSSTASAPLPSHTLTYPQPAFGYYPAPWFHPYLQQVQYQYPYYVNYSGYTLPQVGRPAPPNADANNTPCMPYSWPPPHPHSSYTFYSPAPIQRGQHTDANTIASTSSGVMNNYTQNDPALSVQQPHNNTSNAPVWPHYLPQMYAYPISVPISATSKAFSQPVVGPGWSPQSGFTAATHGNQPPPSQNTPTSALNSGGLDSVVTNSRHQLARKDQSATITHGCQNGLLTGRNIRGTISSSISGSEQFQLPKSTTGLTDWNQWSSDQA